MRHKNLIILLFVFFSVISKAQNYIHFRTGTSDFIEFYINKYGEEEVEIILENVSILSTDTLIQELESKALGADLLGSWDKEIGTNGRFHQISLIGLLCYSELIRRNENWRDIYYYGGVIKNSNGYYKSAIQDYTKALNNRPYKLKMPDFEIIGLRGETKFLLEDYYGAINDLTIGIDSTKSNLSVKSDELQRLNLHIFYLERGKSYLFLNKLNDALENFTNLIEFSPDCGECYFLRGITYLSMGRKSKGCIDLSTAGEFEYDRAYEAIDEYCK